MISVRPVILKKYRTDLSSRYIGLHAFRTRVQLFCALRRKLRRYARPWLLLLRQIKAAQRYNEHKQLKYKTSIQIENLETPNWSNITKHRPKTLWTRLANEHHTASLSSVWNIDSTWLHIGIIHRTNRDSSVSLPFCASACRGIIASSRVTADSSPDADMTHLATASRSSTPVCYITGALRCKMWPYRWA